MKIEDIIKKAEELGIDCEPDSDKPGMWIVDEYRNEKKATFEDIFPDFVVKGN